MEHIFIGSIPKQTMPATPKVLSALHELSDNQWSAILKQLIIYAEMRLDKIGFQPRSELDSINGEDFAHEAIKRLITGDRKWDPEKRPDLLIHLKLIVKSLISAHLKQASASPVRTRDQLTTIPLSDEDDSGMDFADNNNPEEAIINKEGWLQIEEAFGDDQEGFIYFSEWLDAMPPREIAQNYKTDIKVIYNTIKKGRRILCKIFAS